MLVVRCLCGPSVADPGRLEETFEVDGELGGQAAGRASPQTRAPVCQPHALPEYVTIWALGYLST